jgi:Domain of unknown function (DUF4646)
MTVRTDKQIDSASLDNESHAAPLPAYSETEDHRNADFEMVDAPHSPPEPARMTAEQEKAYLADQEQAESQKDLQPRSHAQPSGEWKAQDHSTLPTLSGVYEQSQGAQKSTPNSSRGLQVPCCRRKVTSGFPYPEVLSTYGIGPQEWSTFTSEITQAAQMTSKDWIVTVGAGAATFCASSIFIGWLGIIPAIAVGHNLRRSTEYKNLRAARDIGDLEAKLLRWNETTFAPKGFLVRLDLPGDEPSDFDRMDVYTPKKWGWKCGGSSRARAGSCATESRWAQGSEKRAQCSKRKIAKRGRIMIVPLTGANHMVKEPSAKDEEATGQILFPKSEKELYMTGTQEV